MSLLTPESPSRRSFLTGGLLRSLLSGPDVVAETRPQVSAPEPPASDTIEDPPPPWQRRQGPAGPRRPAIAGSFAIATDKCLAYRSQVCTTCRERCAVPGAIQVTDGRPWIAQATCTGCGDCVATCPAPILAIRFVPPPRPPTHPR